MSRRVRRSHGIDLTPNIAVEKNTLTPYEWMVVAIVPMMMIGAIKIIAIFYTLAITLLITGIYFLVALIDSQKEQPKLHLFATLRYLVIVTIITILYYFIN